MDSLVCVVCVPNLSHNSFFWRPLRPAGGGGEGEEERVLVLRISSDRDDQMGTKRKRKKSLDQNLTPPPQKKGKKIPSRDTQKLSGIFTLFWIPKRIPYSNQGTKKLLAKIFLSKFQTQTVLQSFPSYEIWSSPQGRYIHHLSGIRRYMLGKSYDLKEKDAIM